MVIKIQEAIMSQTTTAIIVSAIAAFGFYMLTSKGRKESIFKVCNFSRISIKNILILIPAGIALNFVNGYLLAYVKEAGLLKDAFSNFEETINQLMDGNFILILISVGLIAPIIEEVIFRELIFKELNRVNTYNTFNNYSVLFILFIPYEFNTGNICYAFGHNILFCMYMVKINMGINNTSHLYKCIKYIIIKSAGRDFFRQLQHGCYDK